MNKLTFNSMFSYWPKPHSVAIHLRTKGGKVSEFKPTVDFGRAEIASWQKALDDAAYFQAGDGGWVIERTFSTGTAPCRNLTPLASGSCSR